MSYITIIKSTPITGNENHFQYSPKIAIRQDPTSIDLMQKTIGTALKYYRNKNDGEYFVLKLDTVSGNIPEDKIGRLVTTDQLLKIAVTEEFTNVSVDCWLLGDVAQVNAFIDVTPKTGDVTVVVGSHCDSSQTFSKIEFLNEYSGRLWRINHV